MANLDSCKKRAPKHKWFNSNGELGIGTWKLCSATLNLLLRVFLVVVAVVFCVRSLLSETKMDVYFTCEIRNCLDQFANGGGWNRGVNLPSPYFLSQFLPFPFFEPISPSSQKNNFSFSPSSLLFPSISPSSQLYLGHFSLLSILFLPPPNGSENVLRLNMQWRRPVPNGNTKNKLSSFAYHFTLLFTEDR